MPMFFFLSSLLSFFFLFICFSYFLKKLFLTSDGRFLLWLFNSGGMCQRLHRQKITVFGNFEENIGHSPEQGKRWLHRYSNKAIQNFTFTTVKQKMKYDLKLGSSYVLCFQISFSWCNLFNRHCPKKQRLLTSQGMALSKNKGISLTCQKSPAHSEEECQLGSILPLPLQFSICGKINLVLT